MGWHNGSYKPRSYARVANAAVNRHQRAQLLEIQALERRDNRLRSAFHKLTEHGYDMTSYGRSGAFPLHPSAVKARRRIQQKWPQHVAAYEGAGSHAVATEIFASFSANLWI